MWQLFPKNVSCIPIWVDLLSVLPNVSKCWVECVIKTHWFCWTVEFWTENFPANQKFCFQYIHMFTPFKFEKHLLTSVRKRNPSDACVSTENNRIRQLTAIIFLQSGEWLYKYHINSPLHLSTSFGSVDFWDYLGGLALVFIGEWYSRQPSGP